MEKNQIRNHQLQSYISPRLWDSLNNLYEPGETLHTYLTNNNKTLDHLETPGDLQDILSLNSYILRENSDATFESINSIFRFIKSCEGVLKPEEVRDYIIIQNFSDSFPNLFRTLMTWAYG